MPVGAATGAGDADALLARERPDVVLLEHRLLDGDGIALCRRLKAERPAARVILYTALPDDEVELLARVAGADGLVDKAAPPAELFEAIRLVARGGRRCRRSRARSSTPPRTASSPTTSRCWRCSSTARRRPTWRRRCTWTAGASPSASSA